MLHNRKLSALTAFASVALQADPSTVAGSDKSTKFASKEYDLDTGLATFTFGNGTVLEQNVNELPEAMRVNLMFHGFMQKVGDSYASAKGDYTKAIDSARGVIEQLSNGEWRSARGEGESKPRLEEVARAIARVKGIEVDEALAAVTEAAALDGTDEQKKAGAEKLKAWRAHPRIKAAIAAARAEAAQAAAENDTSDVVL